MYHMAQFLEHVEDEVVQAMGRMEAGGSVGPYSFKKVELLVVPEDFRDLARALNNEEVKVNVTLLNRTCTALARRRWWQWILLNPKVAEDVIHPSRRVPAHPPAPQPPPPPPPPPPPSRTPPPRPHPGCVACGAGCMPGSRVAW